MSRPTRRYKFPGILAGKWASCNLCLRPSREECKRLLLELQERFGEHGACDLLGVPVLTFRQWRSTRGGIASAGLRVVWLVHALLLRPETVTSAFDLVTWGRFKVTRRAVRRPAAEWTDWCI